MQAPQAIPPSIEISLSLEVEEVATDAATRGRPTLPVTTKVVVAQPTVPEPSPSTKPGLAASSMALGLGVARVSTLVPLNTSVTLDPGLAERMVNFII